MKFDNRNELKSDFYFRSAFSETTKELEKKTLWKLLQCLYHCLKPRKKERKKLFFLQKILKLKCVCDCRAVFFFFCIFQLSEENL